MERELGRMIIIAGLLLVALGLVFTFGGRLGLGRLPGDISFSRGNFRLYVPLGTCLLLSLVVTVMLRLFGNR